MRISRPSPALLIALLAVVVAMSGTAYAALAKNSVGSRQVINNSLKGKDIKDDKLTGKDIKESTLVGFAKSAQPAFTEVPALGAGFTPFGGYNTAGYMIDTLGYVHLKGTFSCPAGENTVFTLPAGLRPAGRAFLPMAVGGQAGGNVQVEVDGDVRPFLPSTAAPCGIDGVVFRAATGAPAPKPGRSANN